MTHGTGGAAIPADVAARLNEIAARAAARHADPNPASAAAVATTRNQALQVLAAYGPQTIPGESGIVPIYAVVMTGSFTSPRTGPPSRDRPLPRPITGSRGLLIVVEAATLEVRDVGVRHWDPQAALAQLGPVTRLAW